MHRAWSGKHTLNLYGALSSDKASILVQARTEHCGLIACLFNKKFADSPACEYGRDDETVLHVMLRCGQYAEARKTLREGAGDRWGDASCLLGGWNSRKDVRTGKLVDSPCESWKPDLKVVKASICFLYQTGRLSRSSEMRVE
jgi:hypothetical protein